jgi:hypothetical protein
MSASAHAVDCPTASFNLDEVIAKIVELLLDASLSMATTQMTAAIPMVIPRTVRMLRILFLSNATMADRNIAA